MFLNKLIIYTQYYLDFSRNIARIRQLQGKQEQFLKQKPAELDKLVEIAKIHSTEAANAIECIRTANTRLKQFVEQRTLPKNRDEEEIAKYKDLYYEALANSLEGWHEDKDARCLLSTY